MFGFVGLLLETTGIIVIAAAQIAFWVRARREFGCIQKAFLWIVSPSFGFKEKGDIEELDYQQLGEAFEKFPHAKLLYEDYMVSAFGLVLTLIGTGLQVFSFALTS